VKQHSNQNIVAPGQNPIYPLSERARQDLEVLIATGKTKDW
jgi:hypothetical protein